MLLDRADALDRSSILGTDFDHEALAKARAGGPYAAEEMAGVPKTALREHFVTDDSGYTANAALWKRLKFRELNLLEDRFGRGYDLVVCRNVMIYFNAEVKSALIARFVESLKPDGVLFIGATEALLGGDLAGLDRMGGNFYRKLSTHGVKTQAA